MSIFLLPQLKADSDVRPSDRAGEWDLQQPKAFADIASSLDYKDPGGGLGGISSVPTVWARPLLVEMALHNSQYPARDYLIEQWQGMLAAIALAEVRALPISVKALQLESADFAREDFAISLNQLLPKDTRNLLYKLPNKEPWQQLYVFLWNKEAVGMSSPTTIVAPSETGNWQGLPWWNGERLVSPTRFLNDKEQGLLWLWIGNLLKELVKHDGQKSAINTMSSLLLEFQSSLKAPDLDQSQLLLSDNPQFFGILLNIGIFKALNFPLKAEVQDSNLKVVGSKGKAPTKPLIIVDKAIAAAWAEEPQNIWVHEGKNLASLNIKDLKDRKILWNDVIWLESKNLFLPRFTFIEGKDMLPGSFLPPEAANLNFKGQPITPLLPLNPILLDYFTPEDLLGRVRLQSQNTSDGPGLRLTLDLPLTGLRTDRKPTNYRLEKDYILLEENLIPDAPVLEIWPKFRAVGWKEYYTFYYDIGLGKSTFKARLGNTQETKEFKYSKSNYYLARSEEFPTHLQCFDSNDEMIGLIVCRTPDEQEGAGHWHVGIDFGTSFTQIYINDARKVTPLKEQNLNLPITSVSPDLRASILSENFITETFYPGLPLATLLITKPAEVSTDNAKMQPVFDGRIFIPEMIAGTVSGIFQTNGRWVKANLKWSQDNYSLSEVFIKHLALHISALAAAEGVTSIQWSLSYPSAFSNRDKKIYIKLWRDLSKEFQSRTGIEYSCPEVDSLDHFRTESLANGQFFADREDQNLVRSTCVDIGGGTSDISIWEDNVLVHQCSVQFAGRDIFSQFVQLNFKVLDKDFETATLKDLDTHQFHVAMTLLLRLKSQGWLNDRKILIENNEEFQGLIRLMTIGFAGLYYYIGILLRVLHHEEKFRKAEITSVYIGGNGSRFLHWLAEGGHFDRHSEVNKLLSKMMSCASGFEDTEERTYLTSDPKSEVACGLVLSSTKLKGITSKAKDYPIAGEELKINDKEFMWHSRLEPITEEQISSFEIKGLVNLPKFLNQFNSAIRELDIEGIKPLPRYAKSDDPKDNPQLWREVDKELASMVIKLRGKTEEVRVEPPFILGLKALLRVLGKQWAGK